MRAAALCALIAIPACQNPFSGDAERRAGQITLSAPTFQTAPNPQPPFMSVVDSIALIITPSGESPMVMGKALSGRDTIASFPIVLREGPVTVEATVLSVNGTVLFFGRTTTEVRGENFLLDVPLTAQGPVLLIAPDTVTVVIPPRTLGQTTVVVHNRGIGNLVFDVVDTSFASRVECRGTCFSVFPLADTVPARSSAIVRIDSILRFPAPLPITFSSDAGDVVFVLRTQ